MVQKLTKSMQLTAEEKTLLEKYDAEHGYKKGCAESGVTRGTWFNILNTGSGRSDNIEKVRAILAPAETV